jgi:predicted RNA-binding protein (virulence factor B family)
MITIGKMNTLKISQKKAKKCFLDGEKLGEIFIRSKELQKGASVGDEVEVFIYSSSDGLAATTTKPHALLGEFAYLKVVSASEIGIFLDWGIDKDLYLPKRYIQDIAPSTYRGKGKSTDDSLPIEGDKLIVYVMADPTSDGVIATTEINNHIIEEAEGLEANEEVDLFVYKYTDLGANVIINNKFRGVIYHNEIFSKLDIGDRIKGYIKKVRDDGKVDVSLVKQGFLESNSIAENKIIKALEIVNGFLQLHDKSSPDEIKNILHMSKKSFKRATGTLYKRKKISIEENGIRLIEDKPATYQGGKTTNEERDIRPIEDKPATYQGGKTTNEERDIRPIEDKPATYRGKKRSK